MQPWGLGRPVREVFWRIQPPGWPRGQRLRIVLIADVHAGVPQMSPGRIAGIVAQANALNPDLAVLLGDYRADYPFQGPPVPIEVVAPVLSHLSAPLGVWAVQGNHDWRDDVWACRNRTGPTRTQTALQAAGLAVLENRAVQLTAPGGAAFWLAGLGSQGAFTKKMRAGVRGAHDLPGTLAQVTDAAPLILLAHEPDIFATLPDRACLTLSGHTHGGQITLFGRPLVVPSAYGRRYAYGHVREGARDLVVSGGLGCSGLPLRFGRPPEITIVELS